MGIPGGSESACSAGDLSSAGDLGREVPWRTEWHPTLVFLPRESRGQRDLVGYSSWGRKESDTTKQLTFKDGENNHMIRGLELSVSSLVLRGGERGWKLNKLPMANDLINHASIMKPS